jgi:hypothetical protein
MLLLAVTASPALASQEEPVWFWFASCGGLVMKLEVRLDQNIIYQSSFPLCRAERSSVYSEGQKKKLDFVFNAPRAIVWQGYRDEDNTTDPNQEIKGDIWLAGADPNAVILGVSFVSHGSIYMNTLHIAYPDRREVSEIESGLVIITEPVGCTLYSYAETNEVGLPKGPWSELFEVTSYRLVTCPDGKSGLLMTLKQTTLPLRYQSARWCPMGEGEGGRSSRWRFTGYDNAGHKVDEGEYLEEKMDANWISWHPNGVKHAEGYYSNGEPTGFHTSWHDNGEIAVTGNYLDGKADGIWVYRDSTGRIVKKVHWHLGKVIFTERFD